MADPKREHGAVSEVRLGVRGVSRAVALLEGGEPGTVGGGRGPAQDLGVVEAVIRDDPPPRCRRVSLAGRKEAGVERRKLLLLAFFDYVRGATIISSSYLAGTPLPSFLSS
jgi:hypothetical protein